MDPLPWTDEHTRLVTDTAPEVADADPAALARTWNVVRARMDDAPPPRRRRRRVIAAGVAAAVLAVPAGLAAADGWGARTGRSAADAEDLRLGGPGEHLDPAGADYAEVIEEETRDIRFPTAAARRIALDSHVEDARRGGGTEPGTTSVSTGAIRGWTAIFAVCAWSNTWKRAIDAGDTALRDEAAAVLVTARTWPAITDLDPRQTTSMATMDVYDADTGVTTTEVHADPTQYYYLREVTRAVAAGDVDALAASLAAHANCLGPALMPDFPQALPSDGPER